MHTKHNKAAINRTRNVNDGSIIIEHEQSSFIETVKDTKPGLNCVNYFSHHPVKRTRKQSLSESCKNLAADNPLIHGI